MSSSTITQERYISYVFSDNIYEVNPTTSGASNNMPIIDVATLHAGQHHSTYSSSTTVSANTHVISLTGTSINYYDFHKLFYSSNNKFFPKYYNGLADPSGHNDAFYINNKTMPVTRNQVDLSSQFQSTDPLYLYKQIHTLYCNALESDCSSIDACFLTNVQKEIGAQQTILDAAVGCSVQCSMTLDDFFNNIEANQVVFWAGTVNGDKSIKDTWVPAPSGTSAVPAGGAALLEPFVTAVVTVKYFPPQQYLLSTPTLPVLDVVWVYIVNFKGVTSRTNPAKGAAPTGAAGASFTYLSPSALSVI
jgi:hypothetical protein